MRETSPPKPKPEPKPNPKPAYKMKRHPSPTQKQKSVKGLIGGFLPPNLYNNKTKKILGLLSTEDLLLIALILLFLEKEEDNDPLTVLALLYILLDIPQIL